MHIDEQIKQSVNFRRFDPQICQLFTEFAQLRVFVWNCAGSARTWSARMDSCRSDFVDVAYLVT